MKVLGLIPARRGSKSIPFKNRALLGGKPLVQWVIDAGKASDLTDLICTTDDEVVMDLCYKQGVKVHVRPEHLSHGDRPIQEIVKAALENKCKRCCSSQMHSFPFRVRCHHS